MAGNKQRLRLAMELVMPEAVEDRWLRLDRRATRPFLSNFRQGAECESVVMCIAEPIRANWTPDSSNYPHFTARYSDIGGPNSDKPLLLSYPNFPNNLLHKSLLPPADWANVILKASPWISCDHPNQLIANVSQKALVEELEQAEFLGARALIVGLKGSPEECPALLAILRDYTASRHTPTNAFSVFTNTTVPTSNPIPVWLETEVLGCDEEEAPEAEPGTKEGEADEQKEEGNQESEGDEGGFVRSFNTKNTLPLNFDTAQLNWYKGHQELFAKLDTTGFKIDDDHLAALDTLALRRWEWLWTEGVKEMGVKLVLRLPGSWSPVSGASEVLGRWLAYSIAAIHVPDTFAQTESDDIAVLLYRWSRPLRDVGGVLVLVGPGAHSRPPYESASSPCFDPSHIQRETLPEAPHGPPASLSTLSDFVSSAKPTKRQHYFATRPEGIVPLPGLLPNRSISFLCSARLQYEKEMKDVYVYMGRAVIGHMAMTGKDNLRLLILGAGMGTLAQDMKKLLASHLSQLEMVLVEPEAAFAANLRGLSKSENVSYEVVEADPRSLYLREAFRCDVALLDLFSGFGDDSLAPELCSRLPVLLKPGGLVLPDSVTAFLLPVSAETLRLAAAATEDDTKSPADLERGNEWRLDRWYSVSPAYAQPLADPAPIWNFALHPEHTEQTREANVVFKNVKQGLLSGFLGCVEYTISKASVANAGMALQDRKSHKIMVHLPLNPVFFPLHEPQHLGTSMSGPCVSYQQGGFIWPPSSLRYDVLEASLELHFTRHSSKDEAWYEWSLSADGKELNSNVPVFGQEPLSVVCPPPEPAKWVVIHPSSHDLPNWSQVTLGVPEPSRLMDASVAFQDSTLRPASRSNSPDESKVPSLNEDDDLLLQKVQDQESRGEIPGFYLPFNKEQEPADETAVKEDQEGSRNYFVEAPTEANLAKPDFFPIIVFRDGTELCPGKQSKESEESRNELINKLREKIKNKITDEDYLEMKKHLKRRLKDSKYAPQSELPSGDGLTWYENYANNVLKREERIAVLEERLELLLYGWAKAPPRDNAPQNSDTRDTSSTMTHRTTTGSFADSADNSSNNTLKGPSPVKATLPPATPASNPTKPVPSASKSAMKMGKGTPKKHAHFPDGDHGGKRARLCQSANKAGPSGHKKAEQTPQKTKAEKEQEALSANTELKSPRRNNRKNKKKKNAAQGSGDDGLSGVTVDKVEFHDDEGNKKTFAVVKTPEKKNLVFKQVSAQKAPNGAK